MLWYDKADCLNLMLVAGDLVVKVEAAVGQVDTA